MEGDSEIVDVVSEDNQVVGQATRGEVHKKGFIHRALSVLVINSKGQILLQQRSKKRSIHAMSWDLSASEHVLAGETYETAAKRSTREELGIEVEVKRVGKINLQKRKYKVRGETVYEYEMVTMLRGLHDGPFEIDPEEVNLVQYFSVNEIDEMIKKEVKFTPWFLYEWENVKKILMQSY